MISIAMATYNGEKYIKKQIDSLLNQSLPFDELIICDDKSTDNTIDIIRSYKDDRIKLFVNKKNVGFIQNFYSAINKTQGDYIFLCDQDDIWEKDKIKECIRALKINNCVATCSACSVVDSSDKVLENIHYFPYFENNHPDDDEYVRFRKLLFNNVAQGCTYCIKKTVKDIYLQIHDFNVAHDIAIMLIATTIGKVLFINKPLVRYRIHKENAIAFREKFIWHLPAIKPSSMKFIDKLSKIIELKHEDVWYSRFVLYLRLPLIYKFMKRKI